MHILMPKWIIQALERIDDANGPADHKSMDGHVPYDTVDTAKRIVMDNNKRQLSQKIDSIYNVYIHVHDNLSIRNYKHFHNYIEIVYAYEGEAISCAGRDELMLKQGDVCLVGMGAQHDIKDIKHDSIIISICLLPMIFKATLNSYLSSSGRIPAFLRASSPNSSMFFGYQPHSPITRLLREIIREYVASGLNTSYVLEALLILVFSKMENVLAPESDIHTNITEIIHHIRSNCTNTRLNDISKYLGYDPNYLSRLIKSSTGRNYKEIARDVRMQLAASLLFDEALPIEEIASHVGYNSTSHFYKVFKEYYGATPKEYRESVGSTKSMGQNSITINLS